MRLRGKDGNFRLRVGDWRVIYSLNDEQKVLLVAKIDQRGRVSTPHKLMEVVYSFEFFRAFLPFIRGLEISNRYTTEFAVARRGYDECIERVD